MVLTIAAIVLISGVYVRFTFRPVTQTFDYDQIPYTKSVKITSFGIAPHSDKVQTFEAGENQKVSLTLGITGGTSDGQRDSQFRTLVNVTDSSGKELVRDENIGRSYSLEPIVIEHKGPVAVAVTNQEDDLIQVNMQIRGPQTQPNFDPGDSIGIFSNWLVLISIPIFGLGAVLFIHDRRKNGQHAPAPS